MLRGVFDQVEDALCQFGTHARCKLVRRKS
jgi:hypothetical protein